MRINKGTLRAYLDHEVTEETLPLVKKRLAGSAETQAQLARLRQERDEVTARLNALAPLPAEQLSTPQAWRRFQTSARSQPSQLLDQKERIKQMLNPANFKRYQPAIIGLVAVALVAVLLSFAPVRAVAGNLLHVFRVQRMQVVPVNEEHVESIKEDPQIKGILDELGAEVNVISDNGEPEEVDSVEEAQGKVGFTVTRITGLPDGLTEPNKIEVSKQRIVEMKLDKALLEALFEAAEIEVSLPDSINHQPILVTQPDTVIQHWQDEPEQLEFVQMASPLVEYPNDLDLNALGAAGLQFLGMSKEEAEKLSKTIDWANTLILPVPQNGQISVTEISINGAKGFLFANQEAEDETAVMWIQNGMTYFINGNYAAAEIIQMAQSVK